MISALALAVSSAALAISILAYRQTRKTALLSSRREAIEHVRSAYSDVVIHGNIDGKTTSSIREALQISSLVFSNKISKPLDDLHGIAFRLQHKPLERHTDKDWEDKELLASELEKILAAMKSEAALNKWL